jgi:serine/threonine protein phosphatase PrpC
MKTRVFGLTDVGRRRESNQDSLLVAPERGLYAVADGMGGHAAGEVASHIAIEALSEVLRDVAFLTDHTDSQTAGTRLQGAFVEGNQRICDSVVTRGEWRGMGTTIVALVTLGDRAVIGHVGDSRAYLLRDGKLRRLTNDHSWVSEQVRMGLMTDEEAHRHPMRNIVTRALGNRPALDVDINESEAVPADVFLLCSDGLNSMLTDVEITETLQANRQDPETACQKLVEAANAKGGEDNITVIVCLMADEDG